MTRGVLKTKKEAKCKSEVKGKDDTAPGMTEGGYSESKNQKKFSRERLNRKYFTQKKRADFRRKGKKGKRKCRHLLQGE